MAEEYEAYMNNTKGVRFNPDSYGKKVKCPVMIPTGRYSICEGAKSNCMCVSLRLNICYCEKILETNFKKKLRFNKQISAIGGCMNTEEMLEKKFYSLAGEESHMIDLVMAGKHVEFIANLISKENLDRWNVCGNKLIVVEDLEGNDITESIQGKPPEKVGGGCGGKDDVKVPEWNP